ncbi:hypothetical protein [Enterobacter roggenkampii]|uniref:hypothetical protein n=1 Tax=Enterobacter roggenkampii TaxID=1812935 RepID=UPI0021D267CE|nr:hypothetical protein [Enterobacter roggenkampii]MCU6180281.1 hypothetical protein [Enterobacter roggenkampii]
MKKNTIHIGLGAAIVLLLSGIIYNKYYSHRVLNIAFIDIERVLNESSIKQQRNDRLMLLKQQLIILADKAEKQYRLLPEEERKKIISNDSMLIKNIWDTELAYVKNKNIEAINKEIRERFSHHYPIVLTGAMVTFADKKYDITDDIILYLESKRIDYGDLPNLVVRKLSEENIKRSSRDDKKKIKFNKVHTEELKK